jgi:ring-1,2-phenylacetyl-CoA epoxidase subunit PaaC
MSNQNYLLDYTLRLADDALVIGHRLGEWCGHGPILEQDIALTNTSLDHIGRARSLYQYAAEQFNQLPADEKAKVFSSVALQNEVNAGTAIDEDDLAYLRDGWDFRNALLLEQPNNDWAYTIARSFYYDTFNFYFFAQLRNSKDESLAAIAEKSLKEVTYHLRWSSEWVMRLGDGTEESHARMQHGVNDLWMYTGELFLMNETDNAMLQQGFGVDLDQLKQVWTQHIASVFTEATIAMPAGAWMQQGGREGRHTEHLGYILAELQFIQRAYPGMEW